MKAKKRAQAKGSEGEKNSEKASAQKPRDHWPEGTIDRTLEDTFPASDPPGWTMGVERRK